MLQRYAITVGWPQQRRVVKGFRISDALQADAVSLLQSLLHCSQAVLQVLLRVLHLLLRSLHLLLRLLHPLLRLLHLLLRLLHLLLHLLHTLLRSLHLLLRLLHLELRSLHLLLRTLHLLHLPGQRLHAFGDQLQLLRLGSYLRLPSSLLVDLLLAIREFGQFMQVLTPGCHLCVTPKLRVQKPHLSKTCSGANLCFLRQLVDWTTQIKGNVSTAQLRIRRAFTTGNSSISLEGHPCPRPTSPEGGLVSEIP